MPSNITQYTVSRANFNFICGICIGQNYGSAVAPIDSILNLAASGMTSGGKIDHSQFHLIQQLQNK